ncbi:GntR family transcriptional regulator [Streptomyces rugosispiralis]|uniref:GntR family transcriptional regulator n=1 Tax=Streptomyces rugosispiralis TaxID=2967341 RepID=A0ABT1V0E3_9ACTN|nr:GntR family transcriptional regulator [Streptomyces rugosispiralis]MCQ8190259.1 GntR family transcriptional regulator [Streptomyces rugosispiralis]
MKLGVQATLSRSTLRERCTTHLREKIISGALRPGEHIVEVALSRELGVSRGTLRESLRPLETEGLIVGDGRGHLHVRELSGREIREVFEVREALEVLAATKLARRADRGGTAAELRELLAPLNNPDLSFGTQIELDLAFHARLCALAGSTTLFTTWRRLVGQIEMIIIAAGPARASDRMRYADHVAIVDAIETGDPAHVASVVSAHMGDFCRRYAGDARRLPSAATQPPSPRERETG